MVDKREEIRTFLKSRRDRITPEQAGLPDIGPRRVPGLRRGEVALLAGISVEYYTRLERGDLGIASDSVLNALATALRLDQTERDHLFALARAASAGQAQRRDRPVPSKVRPGVLRIIEGMPDMPVYVRNHRLDVLAANSMAQALHHQFFAHQREPVNTAKWVFLDPRARDFYLDWERVARNGVGALRVEAAKNPYDRDLSNLIGELSTRSDDFRRMWGAQEVHVFHHGVKRFHHSAVGDLDLHYEAVALPADPGLSLTVYSAEPGTPAEDGLRLLASWAATNRQIPADARELGR
jgi:transcriptional regulator with XRE-family HTH domain